MHPAPDNAEHDHVGSISTIIAVVIRKVGRWIHLLIGRPTSRPDAM